MPLVGRVAAGEPLLAQQHIEGHYQVIFLVQAECSFLCVLSGTVHKDIGIMDGDLLAVHKPGCTQRSGRCRTY
ncbi:S24 family peptidase [Escherichia coli]